LQDLTVRRIGNMPAVHGFVALRATRMKIGHAWSQRHVKGRAPPNA
jgi:hypothetical protein